MHRNESTSAQTINQVKISCSKAPHLIINSFLKYDILFKKKFPEFI